MKHTALACLLTLLSACAQIESDDLRTSGIWAKMDVQADSNSQLSVEVELRSGGEWSNTNVDLNGGDYLEASIGGVTQRLSEDREIYGRVRYKTSFSGLSATGGETLRISLQRVVESDAHTTVTLPTSFAFGSPANGSSFDVSNGDQISLSWSPTDASTSIHLSSSCRYGIETHSTSLTIVEPAGSGTLLLNSPALVAQPVPALLPLQRCELDITGTRELSADVSDAFTGGELEARQSRSLRVILLP